MHVLTGVWLLYDVVLVSVYSSESATGTYTRSRRGSLPHPAALLGCHRAGSGAPRAAQQPSSSWRFYTSQGICVSAALSTGGFAFRFLDNTFRSTDVFNFDKAQLSQFFLLFFMFFLSYLRIHCEIRESEDLPLCMIQEFCIFTHLHLDIWSILHKLYVLTVGIAVYPDQFDEKTILLIEWFWPPCYRSVDHRPTGLFLDPITVHWSTYLSWC